MCTCVIEGGRVRVLLLILFSMLRVEAFVVLKYVWELLIRFHLGGTVLEDEHLD